MLKRVMLLSIVVAAAMALGSCALYNKPPVVVVSYTPTDPWESDDIYLDATQTTDPEGDTLTFTWSLPVVPEFSGSEVDDPDNPLTFFYADQAGDYVLRLVVSDGTNSVQADIDIGVTMPAF
jgi:hypothetical protein